MKKLFNLAVLLLILSSCSILYYPTDTANNYDRSIYLKWKAEQSAQNQAALKYTQSAEFKAKHNGATNPFEPILSKSIVNTSDDPFKEIRRDNSTTSFSATQYYNVKVR